MSKRKFDDMAEISIKQPFKNSLDSDEDDDEVNEDTNNIMNEHEFEGMEDGPEANEGFTPFNMNEELEEGHFDKDGHYRWKKEKQIRDNWLDNIDWVRIKPGSTSNIKKSTKSSESHGLGDSDSDDEEDIMFDPIPLYKQIIEYLKPGETVSRTLCRLGKGKKKLTTAERWKKKKESKTHEEEEDPNSVSITKLTELANELLTRTGNMDIYQESYEHIKKKIEQADKHAHPSKQEAELDMYADDFDEKEKAKLDDTDSGKTAGASNAEETTSLEENVTWDFKWSQNENAEIHGPHTSHQMHVWAKEGYFKKGAWVRRTGQNQFYNAARVDFELYL